MLPSVILHAPDGLRPLPVVLTGAEVPLHSHAVEATLTMAGDYWLAITQAPNPSNQHTPPDPHTPPTRNPLPHLQGGEELEASPIRFEVLPSPPCGSRSTLTPPPTALTNTPTSFYVTAFDKWGNRQRDGGATVAARTLGPSAVVCAVEDEGDGGYRVVLTAAMSGEYRVVISLDGHQVRV